MIYYEDVLISYGRFVRKSACEIRVRCCLGVKFLDDGTNIVCFFVAVRGGEISCCASLLIDRDAVFVD